VSAPRLTITHVIDGLAHPEKLRVIAVFEPARSGPGA
jgi:hypothetical protein